MRVKLFLTVIFIAILCNYAIKMLYFSSTQERIAFRLTLEQKSIPRDVSHVFLVLDNSFPDDHYNTLVKEYELLGSTSNFNISILVATGNSQSFIIPIHPLDKCTQLVKSRLLLIE